VVLLGILGWLAWAPSPATAAGDPVCRHGASETVTILFETARSVVVRRHGDLIEVNGQACHGATIQNTSAIEVHGSDLRNRFQIDLRGRQFINPHTGRIPFHVDLGQRWDKVSVLGTNGPDAIRIGALGINLDSRAGAQVDVTLNLVERVIVRTGPGEDLASANGGFGTGHPPSLPGRETLFGGPGQDLLVGSNRPRTSPLPPALSTDGNCGGNPCSGTNGENTIHGEGGNDTIYGLDGNDILYGDEDNDTIYGDGGTDDCFGGKGDDTSHSCLPKPKTNIEHQYKPDIL
jgi:hypothetical protein